MNQTQIILTIRQYSDHVIGSQTAKQRRPGRRLLFRPFRTRAMSHKRQVRVNPREGEKDGPGYTPPRCPRPPTAVSFCVYCSEVTLCFALGLVNGTLGVDGLARKGGRHGAPNRPYITWVKASWFPQINNVKPRVMGGSAAAL